MATVFHDDFESGGLTNWSNVIGGAVIETTMIKNGTYSGKFPITSDYGGPRVTKSGLTFTQDYFAFQGWVYIEPVSSSILNVLMRLSNDDWYSTPLLMAIDGSSPLNAQFRRKDGTIVGFALTDLTTNAWHYVKMIYDWTGAQGVGEAWVDGVSQGTITDSTSGTLVAHGNLLIGGHGFNQGDRGTVYWDDAGIYDSNPDVQPLSININPSVATYHGKGVRVG